MRGERGVRRFEPHGNHQRESTTGWSEASFGARGSQGVQGNSDEGDLASRP